MQHLGLLAILIILGSLGFILHQAEARDHAKSLSMHAAASGAGRLLFGVALALGGLLFYWFMAAWLVPTLQLSTLFMVVLISAIICELIAALVPDTTGRQSRVHRVAAWSMAGCMLVLVVLLATAPAIAPLAAIVCSLLALYMIVAWTMFVFVKSTHQRFLLYQSSYVISFFIAILVATYLG